MRRQFSLKSKTYTEGYVVDVAGISVKAVRITRGGLRTCYELLSSRGDEKSLEKSAEVIVVPINRDEGQNLNLRKETFNCGIENSHRKSGTDSLIP